MFLCYFSVFLKFPALFLAKYLLYSNLCEIFPKIYQKSQRSKVILYLLQLNVTVQIFRNLGIFTFIFVFPDFFLNQNTFYEWCYSGIYSLFRESYFLVCNVVHLHVLHPRGYLIGRNWTCFLKNNCIDWCDAKLHVGCATEIFIGSSFT